MTLQRSYLDHNATSPLRPQARDAMLDALAVSGNASSVHAEGRAMHARLDKARDEVARLCGCASRSVIFTSCGTEANNLMIRGAPVDTLIVSAIEHLSVLDPATSCQCECHVAPVTPDGVVDLQALRDLLGQARGRTLVSVMLANNETGAIQPVREIAGMAGEFGALVHTDAVQAAGKMQLSFPLLGVDAMTISGHKLGGPQGTGALVVRDGLAIAAQITGGGQELRRRAGTENVAGMAGLGAAARAAGETHKAFAAGIAAMRDDLERRLRDVAPEVVIFSANAPRLPNTTCFALDGLTAEHLLIAFDLDGIAVSSGAACSSGKIEHSHVITAMGASEQLARCAIRVSLGWTTTASDIDRFIAAWRRLVKDHRASNAA